MIPLALSARSDAEATFVVRLGEVDADPASEARLISKDGRSALWSCSTGLLEVEHQGEDLLGDVVLVDPLNCRTERLIRSSSQHNTLLVTEQCDQLCIMCSQPPKKSHIDRFNHFIEACLLAPEGMTIGVSGGEPTLHVERLFEMLESVLKARPDLSFHVLSNGQHFEREHVTRLASSNFRSVTWGIPLYSSHAATHDEIVKKRGAFERLMHSFEVLLLAGARLELRTVLTTRNLEELDDLARFAATNLSNVEQWSIMGLENIGFARRRFRELYVELPRRFDPLAAALDRALLFGIPVRLFNIPHCHIPAAYRYLAVASISDWKQRFGVSCATCRAKSCCSGFFEWHPDQLVEEVTPL